MLAAVAVAILALAQTPSTQAVAWGDHEWRNGVGAMSEHYFRNGAGFPAAHYLENGVQAGSFYHLIFATGRGSAYFWFNGVTAGSAWYWENGGGPASRHHWRNGHGCLSRYGWRNGATCTPAEALDFVTLCVARAVEIDACAAVQTRLDDWLERSSRSTFSIGEPPAEAVARMRDRID